MTKELKSVLISSGLSVILAVSSALIGWSYKAGQLETEMAQIKSEQIETKEIVSQIRAMNENLIIIQTEMKYYRRDIDDLRKKQDEISTRIDGISVGPVY